MIQLESQVVEEEEGSSKKSSLFKNIIWSMPPLWLLAYINRVGVARDFRTKNLLIR